jgi:putative hydrolase of the HAD superfamily
VSFDVLAGVLVDVGGTLWPDHFVLLPGATDPSADRLAALLPDLPLARVHAFYERLSQAGPELGDALQQDSVLIIQRAAADIGLVLDPAGAQAIRRALAANGYGRERLFAGAPELLQAIRAIGSRCVVLSNALWRGAREYEEDFAALGLGDFVDAVVSSVDVGYRKPHPAIFQAALEAAGCSGDRCVMVGNSERNDVRPAVALGLRALRVAIEEPPPSETAAQHVATSLPEAAAVLRRWADGCLE